MLYFYQTVTKNFKFVEIVLKVKLSFLCFDPWNCVQQITNEFRKEKLFEIEYTFGNENNAVKDE